MTQCIANSYRLLGISYIIANRLIVHVHLNMQYINDVNRYNHSHWLWQSHPILQMKQVWITHFVIRGCSLARQPLLT